MREFDEAMRANLILGQQKSRTPKQLVKDWPTLKIDAKRGVIRAYVERVTVGKRIRSGGAGSRSTSASMFAGSGSRANRLAALDQLHPILIRVSHERDQ